MSNAKKTANEANPFENMTTMSPEMFKEGYEKFAEGVSAFADFNKGSLEAMMTAAGAFSKGVEKITAENSTYMKTAYEKGVAAAKSAASAKSVQEIVDIQSEFARDAVEQNLGQANKVAELWMDTTKGAVEPLTERYSEMVEKIQSFRP
ncbi:MAG: TIGR01841 family phasin [Pseudomonadota bacterium]